MIRGLIMKNKRKKYVTLSLLIILIILSACSQKNVLPEEGNHINSFNVDCIYEAFGISTVSENEIYICDKDER